MSSKVSLHAIDQLYKSYSEDPLLMLFTLTFPNSNVFYYVNNTEDITSNGQLYTAFPFSFTLPSDTNEDVPELSLSISNVGLELIDDLSSSTDSIEANIKLVFASVPDFVEMEIDNLVLKKINSDSRFINMIFGYDDVLGVQIPSYSYSAKDYPGLFSV